MSLKYIPVEKNIDKSLSLLFDISKVLNTGI